MDMVYFVEPRIVSLGLSGARGSEQMGRRLFAVDGHCSRSCG